MLDRNLHEESNLPAEQTGSKDGFYLDDLADGTALDIETQHHHYRLIKHAESHARISGHPMYCPEPVEVEIEGSFGGKPPLKPNPGFIGRGMYLVFKHPVFNEVTTSRIREIHKQG